jgi:Protein of unknown function (DUF3768)
MQTDRGLQSSRIQYLNDNHRLQMPSGQVFLTAALAALEDRSKAKIIQTVRLFTAFTEDNDPHGEHDMAFFEVDGTRCFFKLDYYDLTMQFGSEKPWRADLTKRILTIGLAEDY